MSLSVKSCLAGETCDHALVCTVILAINGGLDNTISHDRKGCELVAADYKRRQCRADFELTAPRSRRRHLSLSRCRRCNAGFEPSSS